MSAPFSVYVHLPYCLHKCPYCDFNTYAVTQFPEQRYADVLKRELAYATTQAAWNGRTVSTIFFGGGTPSLFSPATIRDLIKTVAYEFVLATDAEITMEANPGSLEGGGEDRLREFRSAGVNRLSLGGQSFNERHLATLGRIHGTTDTRDALIAARAAGFDNLSCDLIFAVPGQTLDEWIEDVRTLTTIGPDHVSAYNLTYEPGTPLTGMKVAGRVTALDEETELAMFNAGIEILGEAGYRQYEISNFAQPGRESRHNLAYWQWRDYLGVGAGAHGFHARSVPRQASWGARYANRRLPEFYMNAGVGSWADNSEDIDKTQAIAEFVLVNLRVIDGFSSQRFAALFGCRPEQALPELGPLREGGMIEDDPSSVRLSARGLRLGDTVIARLASL